MLTGVWGRGQWVIDSSGITFADYPFSPATVFPGATIAWEQVDDIDLLAPPPTVRVGAELLMVSAFHRDKLAGYAERYRIPVATRHDQVWGDILEPFLDTQFDEAGKQRTMARLEAAGVDPEQVAELRDRFGPAMWLYNFAVPRWEWVHLGLFDLLAATHPECSYPDGDWTQLLRARFGRSAGPFCDHAHYHAVYWESMRIALAPGITDHPETDE